MGSLLISLAADIGFLIRLFVYLAVALALAWFAWRLFKKRSPVLACLVGVLGLVVLLWANWRQVPGRLLAEQACRDIGGVHRSGAFSTKVDGIFFEDGRSIQVYPMSAILLQDGFRFIEYSKPGPAGNLWAYSIEPTSSGKCTLAPSGSVTLAQATAYFYQRGMKFDECLVHQQVSRATAPVTYSRGIETRSFPVPLTVTSQKFTDTATGSPITWQNSFIYYPSNPYRSGGGDDAVDCHHQDVNKFAESMGALKGRGEPRAWAGQALAPSRVTTLEALGALSVEAIDASPGLVDGNQYLAYFRASMDLRPDGLQVWRPTWADLTGTTAVSWGLDADASTVVVPGFKFEDRPDLKDVANVVTRPEGKVDVLAAKRDGSQIFLVRRFGGLWEISVYDIPSNEWRRIYVDELADERLKKIRHPFNPLHPLVTKWVVGSDRITLDLVAVWSEHQDPLKVDGAFRVVLPRP